MKTIFISVIFISIAFTHSDDNYISLKGIKNVGLYINIEDKLKQIDSDIIRNDVELKLRSIGINIINEKSYSEFGFFIYVNGWSNERGLVANISLFLNADVFLSNRKKGDKFSATIYEKSAVTSCPPERTEYQIRKTIKDLTNKFLIDYLKVNPIETNTIDYKMLNLILDEKDNQLDSTLYAESESEPIDVNIKEIPSKKWWVNVLPILFATVVGGLILWLFQRYSQEKQNKRQSFENTFFTLLTHQNNILNGIEIKIQKAGKWNEYKGVDFFSYVKETLTNFYNFQVTFSGTEIQSLKLLIQDNLFSYAYLQEFRDNSPVRKFQKAEEFENDKKLLQLFSAYAYQSGYNKLYNYLGHYFRHLFNILKYLESKEKDIKKFGGDVSLYAGLIQARMSFSELFVLFYDGQLFEKMQKYINKYCLIENLPIEDLIDVKHKEFYECKMKTMAKLLK